MITFRVFVKKSEIAIMELTPIDQYIRNLDEVCCWLGVTKGRATQCKKCLEEVRDGSAIRDEHLMACFEACDLVEIFGLWRENVECFPRLKEKLKRIFEKGPLLVDYERADSVQSRNNAFSAIIAGRLLEAQLDVVQVEECRKENTKITTTADCTIKLKRELVNVECKRLHSLKNWMDRVEHAKKQIKKAEKKGIVALDCSILIRPEETVYPSNNAVLAAEEHLDWLEHNIYESASCILSSKVIGLMLYARVPTMIETPRIGKDHFAPRMFSVISCINVAYRGSKFGRRVMAAININLQDRGGTVNVRFL